VQWGVSVVVPMGWWVVPLVSPYLARYVVNVGKAVRIQTRFRRHEHLVTWGCVRIVRSSARLFRPTAVLSIFEEANDNTGRGSSFDAAFHGSQAFSTVRFALFLTGASAEFRRARDRKENEGKEENIHGARLCR
jgi:hypothetical protein